MKFKIYNLRFKGRERGQALRRCFPRRCSGQAGQALRLRSGQAMTVAVLFMSGLILTGTTVAGLLLTYQIRQGFDAQFSTQAIYAADAGIEDTLYCYFFHEAVEKKQQIEQKCSKEVTQLSPSNSFYSTVLSFRETGDSFTVRSVGTSQRTERILFTEVFTQ